MEDSATKTPNGIAVTVSEVVLRILEVGVDNNINANHLDQAWPAGVPLEIFNRVYCGRA